MMKLKDLLELYCSTEDVKLDFFRQHIVECIIKKDLSHVVLGENGEFSYLYAAPYAEERKKQFCWSKKFDAQSFDEVIQTELPEGYWVFEYTAEVNFYEFYHFDTAASAEEFYNGEDLAADELLIEKALLYIDEHKSECLLKAEG